MPRNGQELRGNFYPNGQFTQRNAQKVLSSVADVAELRLTRTKYARSLTQQTTGIAALDGTLLSGEPKRGEL